VEQVEAQTIRHGGVELVLEFAEAVDNEAAEQTVQFLKKRFKTLRRAISIVDLTPDNQITITVARSDDTERLRALALRSGRLSFHEANLSQSSISAVMERGEAPAGWIVTEGPYMGPVLIREAPLFDGNMIDTVSADRSYYDKYPVLNFSLKPDASEAFFDYTRDNIGKFFALRLDGEILSIPRINEPIAGGHVQISGGFEVAEAKDMEAVLRYGPLPVDLKLVSERVISPTPEVE